MRLGFLQDVRYLPPAGRTLLAAAVVLLCLIVGTDSAGGQPADDHGNTLSTATTLQLGSSINGRIDPGDDLDVFRLDLSGETGSTRIWIYTTGGLDTWGGFYDSDGALITSDDDVTVGDRILDKNFAIPLTLEQGVYYVGVRSYDDVTAGDYTLHAKRDDHGNLFSTATDLRLGSSIAGRIEPGSDLDVFELDLSGRSGTTDVWLYTTGGLDTLGSLYDSNEELLVSNDDSLIEGRRKGFGIRRNLPSGVYYIEVRSWNGAIGDYTLHAEAVTDPGSATGTAAVLNLDSPTPGRIDRSDDADYFRLVLTGQKNLVIYARGLALYDGSKLLPIDLLDGTVLDSTGAEISVNVDFDGIDGSGFPIEDDFDAGTYYVKVTAPASDTTYPVPYTIHAYEDAVYTAFIDDCTTATASLNNQQFDDPLYGCQWHLNNGEGEDIDVEPVWEAGINGEGINIAVVDDTMDYSHEDLAGNINSSLSHDYGGRGGAYRPFEHHGTAVAGIIAAQDNGVGVRGVAPRATIYGYNILRYFEDVNQADAMTRNQMVTAVSNNSWGPPDGPGLGKAHQPWVLAVESGVREGYGGKGTFYVFAGGNGGRGHSLNPDGSPAGGHFDNERGDDSNLDELANYYAVTAVCAVNYADTRSVYSEKGANLWVCAPSHDLEQGHRGIVTTENSDRYRNDFSGTSASAPIVSGVAALLRDANPGLTWRDLKLILAASARKNDSTNSGWEDGARKYGADSAGDRYHFNHEYGFGMVDAKAAVDLARGWTNAPPLETASATNSSATMIPPPLGSTPQTVTSTITLDTTDTGIRFTEFVEINTDFDHTSFRDMDIELVSPSGAVSKLAVPFNTRHYYSYDDQGRERTFYVRLDGAFRFGSARHLGEDPNGVWTLRLTDHYPDLGGTLRSWSIKVYGHGQDLPGPPVIDTPITAGLNSLTVAWAAPGDDGGAAITAYDLRHIRSDAPDKADANWTIVAPAWTSGSLEYIITGLEGGIQYDVQVRAVNSVGSGSWSDSATGITAQGPGYPPDLLPIAAQRANRPGAIYVGNLEQLVGPAPETRLGGIDAAGRHDGRVPLESLERHRWLHESPYYRELLDRAKFTNPTPLSSNGESIVIYHACINHALLPCQLLESFFAPNLEQRTRGQVVFDVTSFPELGVAGPDTLSLIADGTLDSATVYHGYVSGEIPAIDIQSLWGVYSSSELEFRGNQAIMGDIEDLVLSETGGVILNHSWFSNNDQYLFCKEPVATVEDFNGRRTRSHSTLLSDWINGMGGQAQFLAFSEVYRAVERGILDCAATGPDAAHGQRWYEVVSYMIGPLVSFSVANNVVNGEVWESIPDDLQQMIIEEAAKSELEALRLASVQNGVGVSKNKLAGLTSLSFSDELQYQSRQAALNQVIPGWIALVGDMDNPIFDVFNEKISPIVGIFIEEDGTVTSVAVGAAQLGVSVSHAGMDPVRIGTAIPIAATFTKAVTGFTVDDVTVGNGTAGNFSGSGAAYTFDVTPNGIGQVTVNIAANVAMDTDGNGNAAAVQLQLGIPYDDNGNGLIERSEVIRAINDYLGGGSLGRSHVITLINLYLTGQSAS